MAPGAKRIAVVTSSPPLVEGGHLVIARALVRALRDEGHIADVVVTPQNRFGRQASAYLATWLLHGLSLWATLKGLGVEGASLADLPVLVGAVSFATAAGFAVLFAPGGLGVREGLLIAALSGQSFLSPSDAVAAAVVSRLLGFLTEILAAALLYFAVRPRRE